MTGLLRDLMSDKAEHADAPRLDFEAIIAAGDKRVRRRRIVTGVGAAAVAAVVIAAVAVVPGIVETDDPDPVQRPIGPDFSAPLPTYAIGSQIHYGSDEFDVSPSRVTALVRTNQGFVYTSSDHKVYFTDGDRIESIGDASDDAGKTLVADAGYAAWIDPTASAAPELVIYSTADGEEVYRVSQGSTSQGRGDPFKETAVLAMDGSSVYWHNSTGVVVSDVATVSDPISLQPGASVDWLYDAVDGVFARASFDDITVTVSRDTEATGPNFTGDFGVLSPDTTYVATRNNAELKVFEVQSGREVTPERLTFAYSTLLEWLDDDSYLVVTEADGGNPRADVLECSTVNPTCQVIEADVDNLDAVVGPASGSTPIG